MKTKTKFIIVAIFSCLLIGCNISGFMGNFITEKKITVAQKICAELKGANKSLQHPGFPDCTDGQIIQHSAYTVCYKEEWEQAKWAMYPITAEMANSTDFERKNNFRSDPAVETGSANPKDYVGSGYDRGHLVPAASMQWSENAMSESFFMSNMAPQTPYLNRGKWGQLEKKVREWAVKNKNLYVITGPIFNATPSKFIGENRVAIADSFYKVVLDQTCPDLKAVGFVMENSGRPEEVSSLEDRVFAVDEVERKAGLDFFSGLPGELQGEVEGAVGRVVWLGE